MTDRLIVRRGYIYTGFYTCIYIPVYIVPQKSKYLFPNQVNHTGYGEPLFTNGNESYAYKQILLNTNIHIF